MIFARIIGDVTQNHGIHLATINLSRTLWLCGRIDIDEAGKIFKGEPEGTFC